MEQEGVPKKNLILAVVLAFGVYVVWYGLMPKVSKPKVLAQEKILAPATQAAAESPPLAPAQVSAQAFDLETYNGTLLLDGYSPITSLRGISASKQPDERGPRREDILLEGSSFLATRFLGGEVGRWALQKADVNRIVLTTALSKGVAQKEIEFFKQQPGFGVLRLSYKGPTGQAQMVEIDLAAVTPYSDRRRPAEVFVGYRGKEGLIVQKPKKKEEGVLAEIAPGKPLSAFGLSSRYHLAVVYDMDQGARAVGLKRQLDSKKLVAQWTLAAGQTLEIPFYVGLKTNEAIKQLRLKNLLYGGLLGPLKLLVNWTLSCFYRLTGNYGVAIILLTLTFQAILFPLTWKNMKIMKKMKDLAPKIKLLQEKYKNDPKRMNMETMQLYRDSGTNPLGGCLFLLPQMPIFIALYAALMENYELYEAPFVLWIRNLASYDPTYILPLLMGAAMFLQTKMSSSTATDPSQKMMGYLMPAMFTFLFLKFPSGLVLYWLTSNIVTLGLNTIVPKFIEKV